MRNAETYHRWVLAQPPHEIRARIQAGQYVREVLTMARGDPRLTAWEEGFLASLAGQLWRNWGQINLSERQAKVLLEITDKVSAPLPALPEPDWEA